LPLDELAMKTIITVFLLILASPAFYFASTLSYSCTSPLPQDGMATRERFSS
jgi:hypothetical protein